MTSSDQHASITLRNSSDRRYVIEWVGCTTKVTFCWYTDDDSIGAYLYTIISKKWERENSISPTLATMADNCLSVSNSFNTLSSAIEKYKDNITVNLDYSSLINELKENINNNNDTRKEDNNMNLFKGFEFGSCENDNVKMSMYGIAVKNAAGTWVSYDSKSNSIIDVDILNFDAKYLYKIPVAVKDIKQGDTIIHGRRAMFVNSVSDGKLLVIDPAAGEEKIVLPVKNMFNFDFITKVVNLFGDVFNTATADQPFGNMLPLMMLADGGKTDDMLPLMFLMNGNGNFDMGNPMMLYFLMKEGKHNDFLPIYYFMNGSYLGTKDPRNPETATA